MFGKKTVTKLMQQYLIKKYPVAGHLFPVGQAAVNVIQNTMHSEIAMTEEMYAKVKMAGPVSSVVLIAYELIIHHIDEYQVENYEDIPIHEIVNFNELGLNLFDPFLDVIEKQIGKGPLPIAGMTDRGEKIYDSDELCKRIIPALLNAAAEGPEDAVIRRLTEQTSKDSKTRSLTQQARAKTGHLKKPRLNIAAAKE